MKLFVAILSLTVAIFVAVTAFGHERGMIMWNIGSHTNGKFQDRDHGS